MDNLDDLKLRIERVIFELKDIIQLSEMEINDPQKAVSLRQVKEIEASIDRLKRQGLPVPEELKELKLKLFSTHEKHKEFLSLYRIFLDNIRSLTPSVLPQKSANKLVGEPKNNLSSYRNPPNYEKPLGSKGNSNLEDYLIPVIKLMWSGQDHKEAFRQIAKKLDVRYNTVSSQCTRGLGLTTDEFIDRVSSKKIVGLIENKFPEQDHMIKTHLKK